MAHPPVVIVDKSDTPIGLARLKDAETQGSYYRVVAIAITDKNGNILLQKRSPSMKIDPDRWDISVGGHVDKGFTYKTAAIQELKEELGVTGLLPKVFGKEFLGDCFLQLFTLTVPTDTQFRPQPSEVAKVEWFSRDDFRVLLHERPAYCAEFLREIYARAPGVFGDWQSENKQGI